MKTNVVHSFLAVAVPEETSPSTVARRFRTAFASSLVQMLLLLTLPLAAQAESDCSLDFNYTLDLSNGLHTVTITQYTGACAVVTIPGMLAGFPVTRIGDRAFYQSPVAAVTITNTIVSIGNEAFSSCYNLTNVTIPSSVTTLGLSAFWFCLRLTNVTLPNSITSIEDFTLYGCGSLSRVTIPSSVTNLGSFSFATCANLAGVYFNGNAPRADCSAFDGDNAATVYYLPGTTGWPAPSSPWACRPTALWGNDHTITVSASPAGGGVASGGGTFAAGSTRTVTATTNSGFAFVNWTENGTAVSTTASYTFTLNSDRNLVAHFTAISGSHTIAVSASPAGGGVVGGGGTFAAGSTQTVTATTNSGFAFVNWTENGTAVSATASYTFTLNSDRNLVANFTAIPANHTITVSASPAGGGVVSGGGTFAGGSTRTVTATTNSGFAFVNWTENGSAVSTTASYTFTLSSDRNLVANFTSTSVSHTITVSASPAGGGVVNGGGTFTGGSAQTVTATANSGFAFVNWTENGTVASTSASYGFTLSGDRNLVANFTATSASHTVTVSASRGSGGTTSGGGTVPGGGSVTGGGTFSAGSTETVTATADSGFSFVNWTENGAVVSTSASYTFTLNGDRNLVANFLPVNYTVTVSASPAASGSVSGGGTFVAGSNQTVTATANSGFAFVNWTENGIVVSTAASYTFTLNGDRGLVANFGAISFVKGTYSGLFYETGGVSQASSGSFTLATSVNRALSGSMQLGGGRYNFSGKFDTSGRFSGPIKRGKQVLFTVQLQLGPVGDDGITGTLKPADGAWTAQLAGDRAVFSSRSNPAPQAGKYTLVIPGSHGSATEPGGDGYGTLKMDASGKVQLAGSLADGTKLSAAGVLSKHGQWPLYAPLYSGQGSILGWLTFVTAPTNGLGGALSWLKLPTPTAKYYRGGFAIGTTAIGSRYSQKPPGTPVLNFTDAEIVLTGGGLPQDSAIPVTLGANNRVTSTNKIRLTFTVSTGAFTGSAPNPQAGGAKAISFGGVVLQNQNVAKGYFLGASESGEVIFRSR